MTDAGKAALYMRWILEDLSIVQFQPTLIHADNAGAIHLCNAQRPTRRTRHVDQKFFIILQWTDDEFLKFIQTPTDQNYSDSLSKPTARTKFYEHTDIFMGRRKPAYTSFINSTTPLQQQPTPTNHKVTNIIHYISFSTSSNMNKTHTILNNPLYDLLSDR